MTTPLDTLLHDLDIGFVVRLDGARVTDDHTTIYPLPDDTYLVNPLEGPFSAHPMPLDAVAAMLRPLHQKM